jgi:hypothetical protein
MPPLPAGLLQLAGCPWYAIEATLGVPDAAGLAAQPLPALDLPAVPASGLAARGLIPGAPPESKGTAQIPAKLCPKPLRNVSD